MAGEGQPRAICFVVTRDLVTRLNDADSHIHEVQSDGIVVAGVIDEALWAFDHKEFVGIQRVKVRVGALHISSGLLARQAMGCVPAQNHVSGAKGAKSVHAMLIYCRAADLNTFVRGRSCSHA